MKIEVIAKIDMSLNNGATTRLTDLCEELAQRHRVRMWLQKANLPPVLETTPNLQVRFLPRPTPPESPDLWKAVRAFTYEAALAVQLAAAFLRGGRADALYLREVATLAPGVISMLFRIPMFIEIDGFPYRDARRRGGVLQRLRAVALRWQGRLCAGIVTFSDGQRAIMMQEYGVDGRRLLTVPNGADLDRFHPFERGSAIDALGLDPNMDYIVWAGSLRGNQEIPVLVEAFKSVHQRMPAARLVLLSASPDELRQAAIAANIEDQVIARHVDHTEVPLYLAASSVCVASHADSQGARNNAVAPLKLFEYLACGRPAVTADLPWLRFVEDEGLGLVYQASDPTSLAGAILKILSLPPEAREAMGIKAATYVEENHSWTKINARTEDFLRERIAAYRAGTA